MDRVKRLLVVALAVLSIHPAALAGPGVGSATSEALIADTPLEVYAHPYAFGPHRVLPATTVLGTPTTVLVRETRNDGWTRVALPGRPNGNEGWVRSEGLTRTRTDTRVVVDLDDRRLSVWTGTEEVFTAEVAVGSSVSPTPVGRFYVTDAVQLLDGSGPWGPYAFGLSARSDTITEFNGADGIIGIHGTNRPDSIGRAASLGCVRLENSEMERLWQLVTVGMPVEIRP